MNTKALIGVEVKDADQGTVQAVFARFNTKDLDGDVTLPGAFQDGAPVKISAYGHASWGPARGSSSVPMPPVGKGVIRVTDTEAILDGQFFLKTQAGRDTFEVVKELGDLQEWSYGYSTLAASKGEFEGEPVQFLEKQQVFEVSPVLAGAGIGTRTLSAKDNDSSGGNPPAALVAPDGTPHESPAFDDDAEAVEAAAKALVARAQARHDMRVKEGRVLSAANRERLSAFLASLGDTSKALEELLAESDPAKHTNALIREMARFERFRAAI